LLKFEVPPSDSETLELEIRCRGWQPQKVLNNSQDPRTLGIQAFRITVKAKDASDRIFVANTGVWEEPATARQ
jgi:predicted PhzF superfamily epimerase YddE/YHI9